MATLKDLLVSGPARVIGNITGKSFIKEGGTSSQFLKADGSVDSNTYSTTSHNHSGTYKPVQTAVSDPTASTTASTTFIDSISQNANGVIAATKKTLPTASTTVSGITKVGASGGAAAYVHTHATSIATSTGTNQITLAFGTKYAISAGGTSYVFTMPANPNTNTTYKIATGDAKGQIKVTPSSGDAYNVSVKGLGSAAYTESSAYATSGHTHTGYATSNHTHATSIATSTSANQITLAFGTKYAITAGGTSYVFTMPANPNTNTTYTFATGDSNGQIKVTPSGGSAQNVSVKGLGSAAYTESSAYATSGHNHSGVYKPVQTAVSSPSASSTSSAFIDTISQDKNGVITATKKNLPTASTTVVGVTTVGAAGGAAAYSHNHSDVYKPVQTAVSDPTASTSTSTTFIDTISQDKNGVITATKKTLPTASTTVAGITKVGASGGAAAYKHSHDTSITTSNGTNQITLAFGTKYAISAGGTSYVFTMPANPNTNTTYTFATGDSNGQIKVTPSGGSAQNVSVKGLGSAAYTESSAYATSSHNHSGVYKPVQTAVSDPTASSTTSTTFIDTISQNANGVIAATKKTLPTASSTVAGIAKVGASGGAAAYNHTHSFSNITSRGEAYLEWGGKNLNGTYAPIDASMVGRLGANRTAFVSPDAITVEYSRDGGTTWKDYDATNLQKIGFFTDFNSNFVIGKSTSSNPADANCQLRVTLSTRSGSVYTTLNKFIIYISSNGSDGCWCSIDARLQSNVKNNTDTWRNFANKVGISGWSGYNVINTSGLTTYGNTASSQYGQVRFTFGCTGGGSTSYFGMHVMGVNCYGGVGWTTPSEMARNGLLYTYDMSKNATFPANITATKFVKSGGTSSQFLKADGSVDSNTYSTTSHNHSDVYKPVQTAVSDPTASTSTSTTFIDTISQDKNGVITATKKTLPTASTTVAGITKVGASGGAAAYSHTHTGYATSNHTHATSIATSTEDSRITLGFGGKYIISAGGTSYVFTMPKNPNTDTTYTFESGDGNGQIKVTSSTGDVYDVKVSGLGSAAFTDGSEYAPVGHVHTGYATSSHNHSGVYKPIQTAVSDPPTASTLTATAFIDTISQNKNGVIAATKKTLPTASSTVAGITTVGADGGAAAYEHTHTGYAPMIHTHSISIATSTSTNQITLAFGGKYTISAGGSSYVFTMPAKPTTYKFNTGDEKGQIKVTPSSGDAYNVNVSGLGSAAYTDSIDYATSGHTHGSITNAGAIANNTTIANGDHLVITDKSDSDKIKRASITFGASQSTYLRNDGKWGTPSTSTPLATPLFNGNIPGTVIPIATTENEVTYKGDPTSYNRIPSLIFPSDSSSFALPIFMDKSGHLFMLISDAFAKELISTYGYTTTTSGKS